MQIVYSIFAAVIPMTLYLFILWRMDSFEREPIKFVIIHFLFGAIGAVALSLAASVFLTNSLNAVIFDYRIVGYLSAIIIAPFVEELMKGSLVLFTVNSNNFDDMTDGFVYGGAIGLGFGMTENFLYFQAYGTNPDLWLNLVLIRSMFSGVMHCLSTGLFAAIISSAKYYPNFKRIFYTIGAYLTAVLIHSMWNFGVSFEATYIYALASLLAIIIVFILAFRFSINRERKIIFNNLLDEEGILSPAQVHIISSPKRFKKGWIDESIRKETIKLAIKLAFRKMQFRIASDDKLKELNFEIDKTRSELKKILITDNSNFIKED